MSHCGPKTYHTKDRHFAFVYPQIYDMSIYDFKCGKLPRFRPSKIQKEWMRKRRYSMSNQVTKEEMLGWLKEREHELMRPVRLSGRPPLQIHLDEQKIIASIRSLIEHSGEPLTVTREWVATAENINALPDPIKNFIHDLESHFDGHERTTAKLCMLEILADLGFIVVEQEKKNE